MEKVLITGGCGFVGVNLVDYLRRNTSLDIVVLDNESVGRRQYLEPYAVKFVQGDIRDAGRVEAAVAGASAIVHLAADTGVIGSVEKPMANFAANVEGTMTLLEAARRASISRFVFASTGGAIIGEIQPPVHEAMVPRPVSPYGASKLAAEGYLSAYAGAYGMKTIALRFSNVYGPRSYHKGSVVAQFFKDVLAQRPITIYGDGSQTRDFVHVEDICHAIALALTVPQAGGVYQLGSGVATSVNTLLEAVRLTVQPRQMPSVSYRPFRAGEIRHTHSRIDKARAELGFAPRANLADGLRQTWEWFLTNPIG